MRRFQIISETKVLAEVRFHGESVDAAGEAEIIQGTEPTLQAILEILGHALLQSKTMTHADSYKKEKPLVSGEVTAAAAPAAPEVVSDLTAFRAKKSNRRQLQ